LAALAVCTAMQARVVLDMTELTGEQLGFLSTFDLVRPSATRARPASTLATRAPGSSMDFLGYREYAEGDDIRLVDWRVSGRSDDVVMRVYRREDEFGVSVSIDDSKSMLAGPNGGCFQLAKTLAAALGVVALSRSDGVMLSTWSGSERPVRLRSRNAIGELLRALAVLAPGSRSLGLSAAMRRLVARSPQQGRMVVISDFLYPDWLAGMHLLTRAKSNVLLVFADIPQADLLPGEGSVLLVDSESGAELDVDVSEQVRTDYLSAYRLHCQDVQKAARAVGFDFVRVSPDFVLQDLFAGPLTQAGVVRPLGA